MRKRTARIPALGMLIIASVGACAEGDAGAGTTDCVSDPSEVSLEGRPQIVLLADGRSGALLEAANAIGEDLTGVFAEPSLGFGGSSSGEGAEDDVVPGVVSLVTYDDRGETSVVGRYDMEGRGRNPRKKEEDAERQAECLVASIERLAEAPTSGGALLRGLGALESEAKGDGVAVVATGLSRSTVEGDNLADAVGTPEARTETLDIITDAGFIPDMAGVDALLFVQPGEDIESQLTQVGLEAFAEDLCGRLELDHCDAGATIP